MKKVIYRADDVYLEHKKHYSPMYTFKP